MPRPIGNDKAIANYYGLAMLGEEGMFENYSPNILMDTLGTSFLSLRGCYLYRVQYIVIALLCPGKGKL